MSGHREQNWRAQPVFGTLLHDGRRIDPRPVLCALACSDAKLARVSASREKLFMADTLAQMSSQQWVIQESSVHLPLRWGGATRAEIVKFRSL